PETTAAILQDGNGVVHVAPSGVIPPLKVIMQPFIARIFEVQSIIRPILHEQTTEIISGIVALIGKFGGAYTKLTPVLLVEPTYIGSIFVYIIRGGDTGIEGCQPVIGVESQRRPSWVAKQSDIVR